MLDTSPGLVPFTVHRMKGTATLWRNQSALRRGGLDWCDDTFARRFSYGVRTSRSFADVRFDEEDSKTLYAERYGGFGMAKHGGGARVGNLGPFQIKGVGKNPLAGPSDGSMNAEFHSFGGFNMVDAICDVVNTSLYGRVLPLGTVPCYGLILSGDKTAYYPQRVDAEPSPGALMVRSVCLRPAHFVRAPYFVLPPQLLLEIGNDVARTRRMCRALQAHVGGDQGFVSYVAGFLKACARQFAFARLWRICHGSVTPSNLALDGRWLDLMGASFLEPGMNYAPSPDITPFLGEADVIKPIVAEFVDSYSKYCRTSIPLQPLLDYYDRQFAEHLRTYTPSFFGLAPSARFERSPAAAPLTKAVVAVVSSGLRHTDRLPQNVIRDPALDLVERLFRYAAGDDGDWAVGESFRAMVRDGRDEALGGSPDPSELRSRMLVRTLKRLHFSSSFYRLRLVGEASAAAIGGERAAIGRMIDVWNGRADWVFEADGHADQVIVDHKRLRIVRHANGAATLEMDGQRTGFEGRAGLSELRRITSELPARRFEIPASYAFPPVKTYSFRTGILHILDLLTEVQGR